MEWGTAPLHDTQGILMNTLTTRCVRLGVAVALAAGGVAYGTHISAGDGDGETLEPPAPPGESIGSDEFVLGADELIRTSGSTFDATTLSKHIPAAGFQVLNGDAVGTVDTVNVAGQRVCVSAGSDSAGADTELFAPVELPDGARIKRVIFYGEDNAAADIDIALRRTEFTSTLNIAPTPPTVSRTETEIDSFTTSGASAAPVIVAGAADLDELVNTPLTGPINLDNPNRFHTVRVRLSNSATTGHVLCGVRIDYQVAAPSDPGTVFHPLDPVRAFDSRQAALPESGRLGPNETKVIDITDGYDASGVAIPAQANVVPGTATAVAYNITIAGADGPNFVAVTAGDAASFTASAINYSAGSNVANGSSVAIASDGTIKLWGGDGTGSSHVIIDIVGFYSAPIPPNMGN